MYTSIAPMKNSKTNKPVSSGLDSSDTQKATKLKRTQDRRNKRLRMTIGA